MSIHLQFPEQTHEAVEDSFILNPDHRVNQRTFILKNQTGHLCFHVMIDSPFLKQTWLKKKTELEENNYANRVRVE